MKIAQIAPLYESVPPKLYGGTERIVAFLSDALVDLGHEVTLFASGDSTTKAKLVSIRDQAIRLDPAVLKSDLAAHLIQLSELRKLAYNFDFIHFHVDLLHFPFFEDLAHRTITTLHGRLDLKDLPEVYRRFPQYPLVSISESQRKPLAYCNWAATVHHGVPATLYVPPRFPSGEYLAFIGRISPEKGPERAIAIAKKIGMPLRIAAKVDAADAVYFKTVMQPLLDHPLIDFVGEIGDAQKSEFLGNARALLFPVDWPEPFGLVMIEAMACGTPVIAWRHGSVPEVIDEDETGFIVEGEDEAVAAVTRAGLLSRRVIRAAFEERFSVLTMARNYLKVYEAQLAAAPFAAGSVVAA